jgi:ribonucleoside-diphosphate reductase alpha chain
VRGNRIELPQAFFMRVAMGLALNEIDRERAPSSSTTCCRRFDFMSSTPTLFNSGTLRSQLSSCYLTTVADDLDGIYEAIKENALLSKFAGGLGNDWTRVRALGSHIKGTNGKSQGVVPFLKVVNDTAVAVNQGGKRKGAVCAYLETWHLDIEEFLELRKNTGDDRRRTHDMNTANWIPDLFMKRVMEGGEWTLFSPSDVPDLHDKFGKAFERPTCGLREKAARGEIKLFKKVPAHAVAQDALDAVRDRASLDHVQGPCNVRSPQQHVGVVHSLQPLHRDHAQHQRRRDRGLQPGLGQPARAHEGRRLDHDKLKRPSHRDADARQRDRHQLLRGQEGARLQPAPPPGRPGHHGLPGLRCRCCACRTLEAAVEFADRSMEAVCYYAYWASTELAEERGRYSSLQGLAVGPRHPAASIRSKLLAESAAATSSRPLADARLGRAARAHQAARHAQLQLRGDRADRDHLQHHRRVARRSSPTTRTSTSSRTCRASSPSSTSTWCAT